MAQKLDFNLPYNDLRQYVPSNLKNEVVNGLLDNLFNRFLTHDESVPFYGYVGRKPTDIEGQHADDLLHLQQVESTLNAANEYIITIDTERADEILRQRLKMLKHNEAQ